MDLIVLMGGPCSGQSHTVATDSPDITALDILGAEHSYVRTDLTVRSTGNASITIFRRAVPVLLT